MGPAVAVGSMHLLDPYHSTVAASLRLMIAIDRSSRYTEPTWRTGIDYLNSFEPGTHMSTGTVKT